MKPPEKIYLVATLTDEGNVINLATHFEEADAVENFQEWDERLANAATHGEGPYVPPLRVESLTYQVVEDNTVQGVDEDSTEEDMRVKSIHQVRVEELMDRAGQRVREIPHLPTRDELELRARLTLEEALEFVEACGIRLHIATESTFLRLDDLVFSHEIDPDLIEYADACADISVVNTGALSAAGIADGSLLAEVDKNNLTKFIEMGPCPACGGFREVCTHWPAKHMVDCGTRMSCPKCKGRGTLGGYRNEHGKWVKPLDHPKPQIAHVLEEQALRAGALR